MTTRYPVLRRPQWAVDLLQQKGTYPQTGEQAVKDSARREAPPAPPAPVGEQALQAEIAANQARTAEIRAELAGLEEAYSAAALRWDVDQVQAAYVEMNAIGDKRRGLQIELAELTDDAPRLQARLTAARAERRRQEHEQDLDALDILLDEFAPILEQYKLAALDLVELATDLHRRRNEIRTLRGRIVNYCDFAHLDKPTRDVNRDSHIPPFFEAWTRDADPRNADLCRRELGLD